MVQSNQTPAPFTVRRSEPELVLPSQPTPNEIKLLSDIDEQLTFRETRPLIMFFSADPAMKGIDPAKVIKNAFADALVYYYPWAGRMRDRDHQTQKLTVDSTPKGVVFREADADISLEELAKLPLLPPFPYLDKLLCSETMELFGCPMLTIQVTRLSCGGFVFAFRFSHVMSDGEGIVQFITAVAEYCRGATAPSILPVWRRDLLNSREPCHVTPNVAPIANANVGDMVHRNFSFSDGDVATLRGRIQRRCTESELIMSAIWHCRTVSLEFEPEEEVRLAFCVSARHKFSPPLPEGFYGNAITLAIAVSPAGKICEDTNLGYIVELLKSAKYKTIDEYKRSLINPGILRGHHLPMEAHTYLISDVSQLGLNHLDFGWGKAVYGSSANASDNMPHLVSNIIPYRNENGEEVKTVPVYLPKDDAMDRFSKAFDNLLKDQAIPINSAL